jgi:alpha-galactosidase
MKVTFIGAGSAVFTAELMRDILAVPGLDAGVFGLVDVDPVRLALAREIADGLIALSGKKWAIQASLYRHEVLPQTDYLINSIEVAGVPNVRKDYEIPLRYGVDQCIGDTIGPGGLFKALRTLPSWLEILRDVQRLAPHALVMNYTNPMSLTVLAALRGTGIPVVGLCHSIQNTSRQIASYLCLPYPAMKWRAAGINHLAWFVELTDAAGKDLYPALREKGREPGVRAQDPVRFELMDHLGAFMTESSGHVSEYLPYIRKRPDIIREVCGKDDLGGSGYYAGVLPEERMHGTAVLQEVRQGTFDMERGPEFASVIIEAKEKNQAAVIYGNVGNTQGLIENLPRDGVVEVACRVDAKGLQPQRFGSLPSHLAVFNQQHMAFHDCVVRSVLEKDREAAVHALMIDPLTSAVCSLREIRAMFDEMAQAEKEYLPAYITQGGRA